MIEKCLQACCSRAEQPHCSGRLRRVQVIEPGPVPLPMCHQLPPTLGTFRKRLILDIEDPDVLFGQTARFCRGSDGLEHLWFGYDEFGPRHLDRVLKLEGGICRVGASETSSSSDDTQHQNAVVNVIEGMNADSVAWLNASSMETSYNLADQLSSLGEGDGSSARSGCVNVYLGNRS